LPWDNIVAIAETDGETIGLKSDGTVVSSSELYYVDYLNDIKNWTEITAIEAGVRHVVGLKSDGTVVAIGDNNFGQCNVLGWTDIVAVCAGWNFTAGLKADGTILCTNNLNCGLETWSNVALPGDVFEENTVWAEHYYSNVVSKIKNGYVADTLFNTDNVNELIIDEVEDAENEWIILNNIMSAFNYFNGVENENECDRFRDYKVMCETEYLSDKAKDAMKGYFSKNTYVAKYYANDLERVVDFFYGMDSIQIDEFMNEENIYVVFEIQGDPSELYIKAYNTKELPYRNIYYNLVDVNYFGNSAVLKLNIIEVGENGEVLDYSNESVIAEKNNAILLSVNNEEAFALLCEENAFEPEDLGTVELRIGKGYSGVYIVGWNN